MEKKLEETWQAPSKNIWLRNYSSFPYPHASRVLDSKYVLFVLDSGSCNNNIEIFLEKYNQEKKGGIQLSKVVQIFSLELSTHVQVLFPTNYFLSSAYLINKLPYEH